MDIIQQKLVWLLASAAVLLLLFKLDLRRAGIGVAALNKLKVGFILIFAGAAGGMIYRIGLSTGSFPQSAIVFHLESLTGYVFGWAFIIWGTIQWAGDYFDLRGKLLMATSRRWISEKISSSLIDSQGPNRLLESVTDDLLSILSCQAISLHRLREDGCLHLVFHRGLASTSARLIENLKDDDNLYRASEKSGRAMITDGNYELAAGAILETSSGAAASAVCVPVCSGGERLAVLTAYRTRQKDFDSDDLSLIRTVCDGLSAALKRDIAERSCRLETRYREMILLAARPFDRGEPLISALVKSAKFIHSYVPFRKIALYVHDNGKPHSLDFNLPTGGMVTVKTGYFSEKEYPEFHSGTSGARLYKNVSRDVLIHDNQKSYLFPIHSSGHPLAHLKIELSEPVGRSSYFPLLGEALRQKISGYLENERVAKLENQSGQWLGALQYYQQRTVSSKDLSELLRELSSLITDLIPSTFCRIMLVDKNRRIFKTAALAQARKLNWPKTNGSGIFVADVALHRKALLNGESVRFDSRRSEYKIQLGEAARTLPSGIRHGLIIPLMMGEKVVGLLTVGESRREKRSPLAGGPSIFASSIAGLISMALTMHRERWMIKNAREGNRKLTLRQSHAPQEPVRRGSILGSRSRINGPLAGIMASCEYLKSCPPGDISEVNRFIDIIERNATKIHSITSGADAGEQVRTPDR